MTGFYAALMSRRTMPFAEGWYTYYAQCINKGEILYKDFDYLLSPLYILLIAFITKIFGYKIIVLRILGVLFFCLIACLVFFILCEIFSEAYACIATITAVFFLQSEVAQVFYDYVRLMDIFSSLSILLLLKTIKCTNAKPIKKYYFSLMCAGVLNACFYLVKQNMALVFAAYMFVFVIMLNIVLYKSFKNIMKSVGLYVIGLVTPIFLIYAVLISQGSFLSYIELTGSEAIAAKGGISAILFGWFRANIQSFKQSFSYSFFVLFLIILLYFIKKIAIKAKFGNAQLLDQCDGKERLFDELCTIIFGICVLLYIVIAVNSEKFARIVEGYSYLSPYSVFLIVLPLFCFFAIYVMICSIKHKPISEQNLLYTGITGAYLAISYGCGMSGGLAEGQATIGVAFGIAFVLHILKFRFSGMIKVFIALVCLFITVQSVEKKLVYTYNWWGMDESDFWSSQMVSDDILLLEGIQMSYETLNAYETIYHIIEENTDENDSIYCFPQIPIFYSICDRSDPGIRAKVQWFDVVSDASIKADQKVIEKNPPKAIIIYETSEYAYHMHEQLFNNGEISATRSMYNFLLDFVQAHGYTFCGRITSTDNNHILLYCNMRDE